MHPLKNLFKSYKKTFHEAGHFLYGVHDLPSVRKFIELHIDEWTSGRDLKKAAVADEETIKIAKKVLRNSHFGDDYDFLEKAIFEQPKSLRNEAGSIQVRISDICDFPEFFSRYEFAKNDDVMMCVGGPAAEDQIVISSVIQKINSALKQRIYLTRDYRESNVNHSAKQSHSRHASALNADESLTGHALLPVLLKRLIIGDDLKEVLDPDYRKVDVKPSINPRRIGIYFGNELHWIKQKIRERNDQPTEHDINRIEAVISQEIMQIIEDEVGLSISTGVKKSLEDSVSIHVAFGDKNSKEVEHENKMFERAGINPEELSKQEIGFFFSGKEVFRAWKYPGDTHIKFNDHVINKKYAENSGSLWIEGAEIGRILLAKGVNNRAKIAGVVTKDGKYFYCNKLHFTGGYKVDYVFDKDSKSRFKNPHLLRNLINKIEDFFDWQQPLPNQITTATGVSINAIFKRSENLNKVINKYGSIGQIAVTNSHWTLVACDEEHLIVRMTGGGNTGSEKYNPSYFLNIIANTRRIFGDDLIGIISSYGCSRAVNARNSTEFVKIAEDGLISYGKGGTGNTKRHAEAALALMEMGFENDIVEYFNHFPSRTNTRLGDEINSIHRQVRDVKFLHDHVVKTSRRMGYEKSLSLTEMIMFLIFLGSVFYFLSIL